MPPGVKVKEIALGTGEQAARHHTVAVTVHMFLNRGDELPKGFTVSERQVIDLARRDTIAGLRYGIEGMRVGGTREIIISPHLAFGTEGVPGHVPPNAVLRCEFKLLDVRAKGLRKPEDYPPGKWILVFRPGEAARGISEWQFYLKEHGAYTMLIRKPIPGLHWRKATCEGKQSEITPEEASALFKVALAFQDSYPDECLGEGELWSDQSERGIGITRSNLTNEACITILVTEGGEQICNFAMPETSPALLGSDFFRTISRIVESANTSQRSA